MLAGEYKVVEPLQQDANTSSVVGVVSVKNELSYSPMDIYWIEYPQSAVEVVNETNSMGLSI